LVDATHPIEVVAGILRDAAGRVLVAQRLPGTHLAGRWEFPGGKIEAGESAGAALRRELHEELGVDIGAIEPLIRVPWSYAEKSIVLHAFVVHDFDGTPRGRQQQALQWIDPADSDRVSMPAADLPIIMALRLPPLYAITAEPARADAEFVSSVRTLCASGVRLLQLRARTVDGARLQRLATAIQPVAREFGVTLLVNGNIELARQLDLDGVHLPTRELLALRARPLGANRLVAASCHDAEELIHAAKIGVDFAVLGPVLPTRSHPDATPLGWDRFAALCAEAPLPVYALGGMTRADLPRARAAGAQGIAGISAFARGE
jgi:8-oxo-dGTP diphosphatase